MRQVSGEWTEKRVGERVDREERRGEWTERSVGRVDRERERREERRVNR